MELIVGLEALLLVQPRVARSQWYRQRHLCCACCDVRIVAFRGMMTSEWKRVEKWWGTHHKRVPGNQIGKSVWRVRVARKGNDVRVLLHTLFIVSETVVFVQAINRPTVVMKTIALVSKSFGGTAVAAENRTARVQNFPFWLARCVCFLLPVREWEGVRGANEN